MNSSLNLTMNSTLFVTPESDNLSVSTKSYQMSGVIVKRFVYYSEIIVIRQNNVMIRIYLSGTYLAFVCVHVCFSYGSSCTRLCRALAVRGRLGLRPLGLEDGGAMTRRNIEY